MRTCKDGKTIDLRRTGTRWRKPLAQIGKTVWFRKIGGDGVRSSASRVTPGMFVVHHGDQEQFCVLPTMELCEAKVGRDRN